MTLTQWSESESLLQYPGIGKGIAAKINEYLDEQDSDYEDQCYSKSVIV